MACEDLPEPHQVIEVIEDLAREEQALQNVLGEVRDARLSLERLLRRIRAERRGHTVTVQAGRVPVM
jgi:outer membrane protein TolC